MADTDFPLTPAPNDAGAPQDNEGYVLPPKTTNLQPTDNPAADMIRSKLDKLYAAEPNEQKEEAEAEAAQRRSKHQEFIYQLNHSGKSLVQIQTEWHQYYLSLPDQEKHEVWQEFYANNQTAQQSTAKPIITNQAHTEHIAEKRTELAGHSTRAKAKKALTDTRSAQAIKQALQKAAMTDVPRRQALKHHLKSLLFGLGMGVLVILLFLFSFFNEMFIAPFIQPSRTAVATPIIVDSSTVAATATPEVIIPKINVQIPVDYSETSTNETDIENDLESGVVHYPTTSFPGQNGNAAFFGHSSNNIFNKGKYKFAFVLLHELVPGDTFYLTYSGKVYTYKVFSKTIVPPSQVSVLNPVAGHTATATLITCDPPGTSLNRLVVVGDQISPDPSANTTAPVADVGAPLATELAGNGPTLWSRFIGSVQGKVISVLCCVLVAGVALRWIHRLIDEARGNY